MLPDASHIDMEGFMVQNMSVRLQLMHSLIKVFLTAADDVAPVAETLSDVSDMDTEEFIVRDTNELRKKGEMWDTANRDWLEAQELKKAQLEEAHQVHTSTHLDSTMITLHSSSPSCVSLKQFQVMWSTCVQMRPCTRAYVVHMRAQKAHVVHMRAQKAQLPPCWPLCH